MAIRNSQDDMLLVKSGSSLISNVARTISLAFAHDPLVRWLRPGAVSWASLDPAINKWQHRRIQTAILEGYVFCKTPNEQNFNTSIHNVSQEVSKAGAFALAAEAHSFDDMYGNIEAAVILFPSKKCLRWTIRRLWLACKLWILQHIDEAPDAGTNIHRLERLLQAHDEGLEKLRSRLVTDNLWYLEVLAVHPLLQSRGLGGNSMRWVLQHFGHNPIALECTARSNIAFYERYGFTVVEEVTLTDDETTDENCTVYWLMLRCGPDLEHVST